MQRVNAILVGFLTFIAEFLKRFFIDLGYAVYFKSIEFDDYLRQTKTTGQRIAIWAGIIIGVILVVLLLLNLLYMFLSSMRVLEGFSAG